MPIPLLLAPAIGASVVIVGGAYYYATGVGDDWKETTKENAEQLVENGYDFLGQVGEGIGTGLEAIGEGLGELGEDIGAGALVVIRGAGRAIIDSGENMFEYIAEKVSPHRVEAVTAITAMLFYGATAVIVFKKIRGVN